VTTPLRRSLAPSGLLAAALLCLAGAPARAQDVPYGLGHWVADSLGNHRAVVRVAAPAEAVRVHIPWRRRDFGPELKRIIVTTADDARIANAVAITVTREAGDVAFEPVAGAGDYHVYWMPYTGTFRSNYPRITYRPPDSTASPAWLDAHRLNAGARARGDWRSLPKASVVEIQAADSMDSLYPMEVVATTDEVAALLAADPDDAYLLFPEDRTRPIRMTDDLPLRWIRAGANGPVTGEAQRGEFWVFQVGVWAARRALEEVEVQFSGLTGPGGARIPGAAFESFDTRGVDWQGAAFERHLRVAAGKVQALWLGVMVPESAAAGAWEGSLTVEARNEQPMTLPIRLTVLPAVIAHHGDDEPWRLSRLRWLDSRLALDTGVVPPYTPVRVAGLRLSVLGRDVDVGREGWPRQITSHFSDDMTALRAVGRHMLAAPIALVVQDTAGRDLAWTGRGPRITHRVPGAVAWDATSRAGAVTMRLHAQLEFDGAIEYTVALTASRPTAVRDIRLDVPMQDDVARYFMGLNRKGGARPADYAWTWDVKKNQDAFWIGDANSGLQVILKDQHYVRPLNTNFYQQHPLAMPVSWQNGGRGGCRFGTAAGKSVAGAYLARCSSGERTLAPGDTLYFDARLTITPFHVLDTRAQFTTRYYHAFKPVDTIAAAGANVINVHHATRINPFINYPFLRPDAMRAYVDSAHAALMRVKIYYTVRELTNRAPEFWTLRSLGDEVFADGPGGGHAWLQEHVGGHYVTGWVVPELHDIALVTSGVSRWHNFYVEGLDWLVKNEGIDGLYIDDVAFDRTTMQRVRRVLARGRPQPLIDLHSANQYDANDGFASSANLYLEHFPYLDRLWFGEYFDYNSPPDYWLVEMSGIPFGLMGEMLQDGGNPWRGMVFGMTNRLPWAGDPRPLWRAWDDFGIAEARMAGWWGAHPPVTTGRADVLATAYVRAGRTLVAVASWAPDTADVVLHVDWHALGLDSSRVTVTVPAIEAFQGADSLAVGAPVRIPPGRGRLLVLRQR
jgi:hypothetical protein